MKKIILLSLLTSPLFALSQITLEHVHIVPTGRVYVQASDITKRPLAAAGANMNWDYSMLNANIKDTSRTGMPNWYRGHDNFGNSNYAVISNSDTNFISYFELNSSAMYSHGLFSETDTSLIVFQLKQKMYEFPCTYNDNFNDIAVYPGLSLEMGIDIDSTGPLPMVDSIRISNRFNRTVDINGWGKIKTPLGTFDVLRHNSRTITSQVFMINTNNTWIEAPQAILNYFNIFIPQPDTVHTVSFMTNSGAYGVPLLTYNHRNKDTTATMVWLTGTPNKSSILSVQNDNFELYPNPANDLAHVNFNGLNGTLTFIDAMGRTIKTQVFENELSIDLTGLSGVYFIRLQDESGKNLTKTLLVR